MRSWSCPQIFYFGWSVEHSSLFHLSVNNDGKRSYNISATKFENGLKLSVFSNTVFYFKYGVNQINTFLSKFANLHCSILKPRLFYSSKMVMLAQNMSKLFSYLHYFTVIKCSDLHKIYEQVLFLSSIWISARVNTTQSGLNLGREHPLKVKAQYNWPH